MIKIVLKKHRTISKYILIVDCAATCWEKPKDQKAGELHEVIEIGIVPLSLETLELGEARSILVKPSTSKISPFCSDLTKLTQEMVNEGVSYKKACSILKKDFKSKEFPWYSWGGYDKVQFEYQCKNSKVEYPFGAGHVNFKRSFAVMMGLPNEVGLLEACQMLGIEFEGQHHRAVDDAKNFAKLIAECFRRARG